MDDELKNIALMEDSRHRSSNEFTVTAIMALTAFCIFPKKPAIAEENFERAIASFLNSPNSH